jgi:hypothetical protein
MNRASLASFATMVSDRLASLYGERVSIAGQEVTALIGTGTPQLDLNSGGLSQPVEHVLRIRKSEFPQKPVVGAPVVFDNRTLRVLAVRRASSPLAQEWIVEVGTP